MGGIRRTRARLGPFARFGAGVVAALLALGVYNAIWHGPPALTPRDVASQIAQALASQEPGPALSEAAYAAIRPSLVEVRTRDGTAADASPRPSGNGEDGNLGSGVVINTGGAILTSLHVVATATAVEVIFADGTVSEASITARQPAKDIAVLQPSQLPAQLVPATLGNPRPAIGSDAYAVGNPFGLDGSITAGVVSALDRSFQPETGGPELTGLIQIDAAVNPGNSGGPLVDRFGRVMGIVTALVNPTEDRVFIGIGLAVPIDVAGGAAGLPND